MTLMVIHLEYIWYIPRIQLENFLWVPDELEGGLVLLKIHNCSESHLKAASPQSILTTITSSVCTKPKFLMRQFLDVEDVDAECTRTGCGRRMYEDILDVGP